MSQSQLRGHSLGRETVGWDNEKNGEIERSDVKPRKARKAESREHRSTLEQEDNGIRKEGNANKERTSSPKRKKRKDKKKL